MGFSTAIMADTRLKAVSCEDCAGNGVQALNNGVWGPFAPNQLTMTDASPYLEAPQANKRTCSSCLGKGFNWLDIPINHNYKPPNMGYIEHTRRTFHWPWR